MRVVVVTLFSAAAAGCFRGPTEPYLLPASEAERYPTAYIAVVAADADGDDLERGAGEYLIIRNNSDHRTDMGGWYVTDADDDRLPLGVGRQIDPGAELRLHTACGDDTDEAVFACRDEEVLDDGGDTLTLRDSAGSEVAVFAYGDAVN